MLIPLNIRVEKRLLRDLERFADEQHLDKAAFLREVIHKGFENAKQEMILKQYAKKEISAGEICERLGLNRWEFFDLLKAHNAYLNLDLEDFLSASRLTDAG
jgi:DNA-directed RNA polymerase specialized sigma subunit